MAPGEIIIAAAARHALFSARIRPDGATVMDPQAVLSLGTGNRWARRYGGRTLLRRVTVRLRRPLGEWVARRFDRRHGVDTGGEIASRRLEVLGAHAAAGADFMSTPPRTFRRSLRGLPEDLSGFAFIDIGCGKGRALLLAAAAAPFRRVIGIDHSPELVKVANRNIAAWRGPRRCHDVQAICADAACFELPPEPCILYFFGPIDDYTVLAAVLANVAASLRARPRPCYAIYVEDVMAPFPDAELRAAGFRPVRAPRIERFDAGITRHPLRHAVYSASGREPGV